jgi:hypothetical protein
MKYKLQKQQNQTFSQLHLLQSRPIRSSREEEINSRDSSTIPVVFQGFNYLDIG